MAAVARQPYGVFSGTGMTRLCLLSGLAGGLVWLASALVNWLARKNQHTHITLLAVWQEHALQAFKAIIK